MAARLIPALTIVGSCATRASEEEFSNKSGNHLFSDKRFVMMIGMVLDLHVQIIDFPCFCFSNIERYIKASTENMIA